MSTNIRLNQVGYQLDFPDMEQVTRQRLSSFYAYVKLFAPNEYSGRMEEIAELEFLSYHRESVSSCEYGYSKPSVVRVTFGENSLKGMSCCMKLARKMEISDYYHQFLEFILKGLDDAGLKRIAYDPRNCDYRDVKEINLEERNFHFKIGDQVMFNYLFPSYYDQERVAREGAEYVIRKDKGGRLTPYVMQWVRGEGQVVESFDDLKVLRSRIRDWDLIPGVYGYNPNSEEEVA